MTITKAQALTKNRFLAALLGAFALSLAWPGAKAQCLFSGALIALVAARDARALLKLGRLKFWLFPLAFVLLSPFMAGTPDTLVYQKAYSVSQLLTNLRFMLHAYCLVILLAYFGRNYSLAEIVELGQRLGLKTLGLRVALAVCAAKKLELMIAETCRVYIRTRPATTERLAHFPVLAGAVLRNTVIIAEEISVLLFIRKIEL